MIVDGESTYLEIWKRMTAKEPFQAHAVIFRPDGKSILTATVDIGGVAVRLYLYGSSYLTATGFFMIATVI